ncbi:MAG: hypothetical protein JXA36_06750 [Coriobacteriia bacterium]|nr:hypothetical protein [Coriobacteriia bacterium]
MRIVKRIAAGLGIVVLVTIALAAAAYFFGGMWVRTPAMKEAHEELVAEGLVPEIEERFVIPIPGCVCHSDDPVLQAEHSVRRIRECANCH